MNKNIKIAIVGLVILLTIIGIGIFKYASLFSAPQKQTEVQQFTIAIGKDDSSEVAQQLKEQGFIKSELGFKISLLGLKGVSSICVDCISPGAYKISKAMNAREIAKILQQEPYMKWVIIPEGFRKEQIAEILAETLGWTDEQKSDWITKYTAMNYDYIEGVYFPDTYLIPTNETPLDIAQRFINKFNEKFAPYADKFTKANIKWTTALKIASLVQREAGGKNDMPLIAGILWNRLLKDMRLEIDATIQYINDSRNNYLGVQCGEITPCVNQELTYSGYTAKKDGWWQPIKSADIQKTSAYNTYLNKGLPPHPIANPSLAAIDAVLNSAETECLFYLHDSNRQIHCAKTYEEHLANIEKYLRN